MKTSLKIAVAAIKANLKPGLLLWALLSLFAALYFLNPSFRSSIGLLGQLKIKLGYLYTVLAYMLFAAVLPEMLKILTLQKGKILDENKNHLLFAGPVFGFFGVVTDIFYKLQGIWFGHGNDLHTVVTKTIIDQALFTPFANTLIMLLFLWKIKHFKANFLKGVNFHKLWQDRLLPILVVTWFIWIPGAFLVYNMSAELQLPIGSLILCFWALIISFVNGKNE
jgi:hypothetical protein